MSKILPPISVPELFVGIVARMGVDNGEAVKILSHEFNRFGYHPIVVKVTDTLRRNGPLHTYPFDVPLVEQPIDKRIGSYISACNQARRDAGRNELFAYLSLEAIRKHRAANAPPDAEDKQAWLPEKRNIVFIIDQFKRHEEVQFFREIYGERFFQFSYHAPYDTRIKKLKAKLIAAHPEETNDEKWAAEARALIARDENEDNEIGGQEVREAFPLADVVFDASKYESLVSQTQRFLRLLFGEPTISPEFNEYGNHIATQAALRSIDLSRQVGAAIFDDHRRVISLGTNEVPSFGGGTYWEDTPSDARDAALGIDINQVRKRSMVIDVVVRLKKNELLCADLQQKAIEELEPYLLGDKNSPLAKSDILNILEYGRALHAEMNAITDAAGGGRALADSTLFCTTFPCHNCAKHIVGTGIKRVYYLQPFAKSGVTSLYPDSIAVDPDADSPGKVEFRQFTGITSRRFNLFETTNLKKPSGELDKFVERPKLETSLNNYTQQEALAIHSVTDQMSNEFRRRVLQ